MAEVDEVTFLTILRTSSGCAATPIVCYTSIGAEPRVNCDTEDVRLLSLVLVAEAVAPG